MNIYRITSFKNQVITCLKADYKPLVGEQTYFSTEENGQFICMVTQAKTMPDAMKKALIRMKEIRKTLAADLKQEAA